MNKVLICEACGKEVGKLYKHHWYQPPEFEKHDKLVCTRCNQLLNSTMFGFYSGVRGDNHVLPAWQEQCEFIDVYNRYTEWQEDFKRRCEAKYGTLYIPYEKWFDNPTLRKLKERKGLRG